MRVTNVTCDGCGTNIPKPGEKGSSGAVTVILYIQGPEEYSATSEQHDFCFMCIAASVAVIRDRNRNHKGKTFTDVMKLAEEDEG